MSPEEKKEAEQSLFFPVDASANHKLAALIFEHPKGIRKMAGKNAFWNFVLSVHEPVFLKLKNAVAYVSQEQMTKDRESFALSSSLSPENGMIAAMQSRLPGNRTMDPELNNYDASALQTLWVKSFEPGTQLKDLAFPLAGLTDYSKLMRAQWLYASMKNGLGQENDAHLLAEYLRFSQNNNALDELRRLFAAKKLPIDPFQSVQVIHEPGDEIAPFNIQELGVLSLNETIKSSVVSQLNNLLQSMDFLVNFQTLNQQDVGPHERAIGLILAVFHPFKDPFDYTGLGYSHCFKDSWPLLKSWYAHSPEQADTFNKLHTEFSHAFQQKADHDKETKKCQKEKAFENQVFHAEHSKKSNAVDLEWKGALDNLLAVCKAVDPQLKIFTLLSYNAVAQEFVKEGLSDQYDMERLKEYCFWTAVCQYTSQEVLRRAHTFRSPPSVPTLSTSEVFNSLRLDKNLFGFKKSPSATAQPK